MLVTNAITSPAGLNATPKQSPVGNVEGSVYFVPKPLEVDQG